jgi:hypothetical protein
MNTRRSFITGLISFVAAPAIIRAGNLMPVKSMEPQGILYRAISVEEMIDRMMDGPAISAALLDFGAFGTAIVEHRGNDLRHIPLQEWHW